MRKKIDFRFYFNTLGLMGACCVWAAGPASARYYSYHQHFQHPPTAHVQYRNNIMRVHPPVHFGPTFSSGQTTHSRFAPDRFGQHWRTPRGSFSSQAPDRASFGSGTHEREGWRNRNLNQVLHSNRDREFLHGLTEEQRHQFKDAYSPRVIQALRHSGQWDAAKQAFLNGHPAGQPMTFAGARNRSGRLGTFAGARNGSLGQPTTFAGARNQRQGRAAWGAQTSMQGQSQAPDRSQFSQQTGSTGVSGNGSGFSRTPFQAPGSGNAYSGGSYAGSAGGQAYDSASQGGNGYITSGGAYYGSSNGGSYSSDGASSVSSGALKITGGFADYSASSEPFTPTINFGGQGLNSLTQISWACTMPDGSRCTGSPYVWTPSNVPVDKLSVTSDTTATARPTLLAAGDPPGLYHWTATFYGNGQKVDVPFVVRYSGTSSGGASPYQYFSGPNYQAAMNVAGTTPSMCTGPSLFASGSNAVSNSRDVNIAMYGLMLKLSYSQISPSAELQATIAGYTLSFLQTWASAHQGDFLSAGLKLSSTVGSAAIDALTAELQVYIRTKFGVSISASDLVDVASTMVGTYIGGMISAEQARNCRM